MASAERSPLCAGLAGVGGGLMSTIVCSPLDVAKTRLQMQAAHADGSRTYHGLRGALRTTWLEEGLRGFYRGVTPSMCAVPMYWGLYFPLYNAMSSYLESNGGATLGSRASTCLAAVGAGIVANTATNPFWVVRTHLIKHAPHPVARSHAPTHRHSLRMHEIARSIMRYEGVRGLYRGLSVSVLGLTSVAIQFPLYEELKRYARSCSSDGREGITGLVFASALSKMVASLATYPHEVLRTHVVAQHGRPSLVHGVRAIFAARGMRGFYQGLGTHLVRTLPAAVVNLLTYEYIRQRYVEWLQGDSPILRVNAVCE